MPSLRDFYRKLRADCETTAAVVKQQSLASPSEIAAHQPGGDRNPDRGPEGWLSFYRWLHRTHATGGARGGGGGRAPAAHPDDGIALDTLRATPERVELVEPVPVDDGEPMGVVYVHPKGFTALVVCHALNLRLGYLVGHLERHKDVVTVHDLELTEQAWERVRRYLARLAWIVTHPGPGLPFDHVTDLDPSPPAWVAALSPVDIHRLCQTFQQVNAVRLVALDKLVAPDPEAGQSAQRPSWSIFFATAAGELGVRERELMDDYDLPGLVAKLRLTSSAKRQAMEEAEARAERQRGHRQPPATIPR